MAMCCDPFFKNYQPMHWDREVGVAELKARYTVLAGLQAPPAPLEQLEPLPLFSSPASLLQFCGLNQGRDSDEWTKWLHLPGYTGESTQLEWWALNIKDFPNIGSIAARILSSSCSSASVESRWMCSQVKPWGDLTVTLLAKLHSCIFRIFCIF